MATETNLNKINVFPDNATYEANASSLGENEISLVKGGAVVVETSKSADKWYKVYSDGFVEMGGVVASVSGGIANITLPVAINTAGATTSLAIINSTLSNNTIQLMSLTSTSCQVATLTSGSSAGMTFSWEVRGYKA